MAEDKNPIQVAGRLFAALEYIAANGSSSLAQISEAIGLNKSTAHRVISSLQYMGYVRQDDPNGKYEATLKIAALAENVLGRLDIIRLVRPSLEKLMELTGETVHLVRAEDTDIVYIDKVESAAHNYRMVSHIGSRIPFYRSAVGKAIAACMSDEEVQDLWNRCRIERTTPYTITDRDDFMEALEEVRRKGYALDNEENETGVRCIGAALQSGAGRPVYAFSVSVPIARMDNDRIHSLASCVLDTKKELEDMLRGSGFDQHG